MVAVSSLVSLAAAQPQVTSPACEGGAQIETFGRGYAIPLAWDDRAAEQADEAAPLAVAYVAGPSVILYGTATSYELYLTQQP